MWKIAWMYKVPYCTKMVNLPLIYWASTLSTASSLLSFGSDTALNTINNSSAPQEGKYLAYTVCGCKWHLWALMPNVGRTLNVDLISSSNASPMWGVLFTSVSIYLCDLYPLSTASRPPPVTHSEWTLSLLSWKMQAEEYNRRGNHWLHSTIFSIIQLYSSANKTNTISKISFSKIHWSHLDRTITLAVTVIDQVRSWWTTSHSTWVLSGRGGSFQMWSRDTWGSFSLTLHRLSRRSGRASSRISKKSSCLE